MPLLKLPFEAIILAKVITYTFEDNLPVTIIKKNDFVQLLYDIFADNLT